MLLGSESNLITFLLIPLCASHMIEIGVQRNDTKSRFSRGWKKKRNENDNCAAANCSTRSNVYMHTY